MLLFLNELYDKTGDKMSLNKRISVRLTETDYIYLEKIMEKEGETTSNVIRSLIHEKHEALERGGVSNVK